MWYLGWNLKRGSFKTRKLYCAAFLKADRRPVKESIKVSRSPFGSHSGARYKVLKNWLEAFKQSKIACMYWMCGCRGWSTMISENRFSKKCVNVVVSAPLNHPLGVGSKHLTQTNISRTFHNITIFWRQETQQGKTTSSELPTTFWKAAACAKAMTCLSHTAQAARTPGQPPTILPCCQFSNQKGSPAQQKFVANKLGNPFYEVETKNIPWKM